MKTAWRAWLVLCAALSAPLARAEAPPILSAQGTVQAAFAPWDDIDTLLIDSLAQARQQVLVQAYLLTSKKISAALIAAKRRGLDVQVLLDARQLERVSSSSAPGLAGAGVTVWVEHDFQNAHNKVVILDPALPTATVITGSFNFTWTAQHRNAENVLIVRGNPLLARRYAENWERHRRQAKAYKP